MRRSRRGGSILEGEPDSVGAYRSAQAAAVEIETLVFVVGEGGSIVVDKYAGRAAMLAK